MAVVFLLYAFETYNSQKGYKFEGIDSLKALCSGVKNPEFRQVSPFSTKNIEEDAMIRLYEQVGFLVPSISEIDEEQLSLIRQEVRYSPVTIGAFLMIFLLFDYYYVTLSYIFYRTPWLNEYCEKETPCGPFVPYFPQAWKWKMPPLFRITTFLHFVFGGLANIIAVLLCLEGISFAFLGKMLLIEKFAYLWSWLFAIAKVLLGNALGQLAGDMFVLMISLPYLMLFGSFVRRLSLTISLYIRVLYPSNNCSLDENQKLLSLRTYVKQTCSEHRLRLPILLLTDSQNVILNIHHILLTNTAVIEISRSVINLLNLDELKAAIAHEIAHIKQGQWKVAVLKQLSLLALFPNHYLTLCIDWPRKEIDADRFALEATKDVHALKQALIKISTAQVFYVTLDAKPQCLDKWFNCFIDTIRRKLNSLFASIRFFFGDGLFGYTHPYLSERLQMIDSYSM
jgi:Zn-dependent protease with chaperone function